MGNTLQQSQTLEKHIRESTETLNTIININLSPQKMKIDTNSDGD